ncbi:MAG: hypothetical protein EBZ76_14270, partial [Synechococcaceae bacterium WB9_2_170]|nr:hypothetical protein [Synechococcaceae bacterium WB9_2_170]
TPADQVYGLGHTLTFGLAFDEPVQVTGTPILQLSDGLQARFDAARSDLATGRVAFSYAPASGDQSADLKTNTQPLLFPSGSAITDRSGNAATAQAPAFDAAVVVDGRPPVLNGLSALGGSYGPNRTVSINLLFNEPVRWQAQSAGAPPPVLQLSAGLSATLVAPTAGQEWSATQRFDLLTGSQPPDVQSLQVQGLSGLGQFTDAGGNALVAPQASSWTLPQAIAISSKVSWTLDVDGDGAVTPLGDGLMVIRKLFGSAFKGDALTAKAISPTATRSSAEIHAYIQQGIDQGFLDIDHDGSTTALGDGLMVIRQLFGSFRGDALINKAISETSGLIPKGQ